MEAIRILTLKFKDSRFAPKGLYITASEDEKNTDEKAAYANYKKIISNYSSSEEFVPSLFGAINALAKLKKYDEAFALADSFLTKNPGAAHSPRLLYRKGQLMYSLEKWNDASQIFEHLISQYPHDTFLPWAKYMLAKSLKQNEEEEKAHALFSELTEKYSERDVASFAYLELARSAKNTDQAASYFTKAFDIKYYSSESAPRAMFEYVRYLEKDDPDSAVHVADELAERYTDETSIGGAALVL